MKEARFIIPTPGNRITNIDIRSNKLRITIDNETYFPNENCYLKVMIDDIYYDVRFSYREGRSHVLYLGIEAMTNLNIGENNSVEITISDDTYILKKV